MAVRSPHAPTKPKTLEHELFEWAIWHFPAAALAYEDSTDGEYRNRCLGSIVRRRAEEEFAWLVWVAEERPRDLAKLGPWIGSAGGYPSKGMTFAEWVEAVALIAGV